MYSESTEKALLGSLMIQPKILDLAQKWIDEPDVFYFDFHKNIWETILSLDDRDEDIDAVSILHNYPQKDSITKEIAYKITEIATSEATQSRAEELGLGEDCYQGGLNKLEAYEEILKKGDYTHEDVAYIGDDLIDMVVMERVGLPIAVANAHPLITKIAKMQTKAFGGEGAFREAIEEILSLRGEYDTVLEGLYNRIINGDSNIKSQ